MSNQNLVFVFLISIERYSFMNLFALVSRL